MVMCMPPPKAPCQDCPDRTVGCHGTCEKYAEYKSNRDKLRCELQKKARDEEVVNGYKVKEICKGTGKKLKML